MEAGTNYPVVNGRKEWESNTIGLSNDINRLKC